MNYTALQVKTSYSFLNSLNDIKKLVIKAKEYGYTSLAITDECNMFGVIEFYTECKKNNLKPIIGIELSYNEKRFLLYAKNLKGYKNLIKLSTIISSNDLTLELLKEYNDNLILIMPFSYYDKDLFEIYDDKYWGYTSKEECNKIDGPKVFINDVCYLKEKDYQYLDYAKMILQGKKIGEYVIGIDKGHHLLTREEFLEVTSEDVRENMLKIVNDCNVELNYTSGLLPIYDKDIDSKEYLKTLVYKGITKRLKGNLIDEYLKRIDYELDVINQMGFNDYFLIVYDYVLYAKKNNILVGPGRGSAAGSLVSYSLGITDIDPIKYNLLFERFLNPERVTLPDIDIDFDANRRNEVIDYVTNKYGEKKVAGIITFNTLGAKQVLRDVGRVLNINMRLIDTLAKMCFDNLQETYEKNNNFNKLINSSLELKKLYEIALNLEGLPRHISMHAAGIVMSNKEIDEIIPLYKNQLGMYVTAYSKDYLEELGLLKMDFLGVSNLTLITEIINNIRDFEGLNITFANIPDNDQKTFSLFANGDTEGIFQFESMGMRKFLKKLKPNDFSDIVAAMALYRPGPMDSIDDYILRRKNPLEIDYLHDDIKEVLKETYGIMIYQEQIMQIARIIAGYTLGEADILRRAMSKKKEDILLKECEKFIKQSQLLGYSNELANKVYDLILKFANYGFNKSHAVAYSMISYKMAFLKTHFYAYFMVALLNHVINNEEKSRSYIAMLRSKGIQVIVPDINISTEKYQIINKKIICPLTIINNIGMNTIKTILKERENLPFDSFINFVKRVDSQILNKKILMALIYSGVFSSFGYNKRTLINNLDNILNYIDLVKGMGEIQLEEPVIDEYEEYSKDELIKYEFDSYGFYLTEHPVSKYRNHLSKNTLCLEEYVNQYIELILEVNQIKEVMTKNNDVMAFVKASDEYCQVELTIFPKVYKNNHSLNVYDIIKIYGRIDKRFDKYQVVVSNIQKVN